MADYFVAIGNKEYQVKIVNGGLTVDGEPLEVSLTPLDGRGMQLMRRNQQAVEIYFSHEDAQNYQVLVEGHLVHAQVRSRGSRPKANRSQDEGGLVAPMPGLVIEVNVNVGDEVEKGQLLAVVESMKMQMQMRSAVKGSVKKIAVKAGEQVQKGQLLVFVNPF